jgi:ADP-ribosyl-[dinitrogen reductase] hydrolase
MDQRARFRGCLLGLAAGDAVGTAVEFKARGTFSPVTGMVGGGPFGLEPGQWTDDTSMALCLATSLVEMGRFDADDQMAQYVRWWREGYLSSNGICFDIGNTVSSALRRYRVSGEAFSGSTDPNSAGNGCIMRLAPIPMFFWRDRTAAIEHAAESSRTTHGAAECLDACRLFCAILLRALAGEPKEEVLLGKLNFDLGSEKIASIAEGAYLAKSREEIRGSGYVVHSLEAALWCFQNSNSYREAVLMAVNLGEDADTTAAVCGQVAGAYYGLDEIPADWLAKLAMREEISALADRLWGGPE